MDDSLIHLLHSMTDFECANYSHSRSNECVQYYLNSISQKQINNNRRWVERFAKFWVIFYYQLNPVHLCTCSCSRVCLIHSTWRLASRTKWMCKCVEELAFDTYPNCEWMVFCILLGLMTFMLNCSNHYRSTLLKTNKTLPVW